MLALVRARDFEMERLTKACEIAITESPSCGSVNDEFISKQSYHLAMLNEKLKVFKNLTQLFN